MKTNNDLKETKEIYGSQIESLDKFQFWLLTFAMAFCALVRVSTGKCGFFLGTAVVFGAIALLLLLVGFYASARFHYRKAWALVKNNKADTEEVEKGAKIISNINFFTLISTVVSILWVVLLVLFP